MVRHHVRDVAALGDDVVHAHGRADMLAQEIDHRAKNVLAIAQSIVRLSHAETIEEYVEAVEGRISALARVHTLLAKSRWEGADLRSLADEELAPFRTNQPEQIAIDGPALSLEPRLAQGLTLALHELSTNAAKYGALSVPEGIVSINWTATDGPPQGIRLRWQEMHGPTVTPPTRIGFGSRLVERLLASELGGEARITYLPQGVVCEIEGSLTADGHEDP